MLAIAIAKSLIYGSIELKIIHWRKKVSMKIFYWALGWLVFSISLIIFVSFNVERDLKEADKNIAYFEKINEYVSELEQKVSSDKELVVKVQKIDSTLIFLENYYKSKERRSFEIMRKIHP